MIQLAHETRGYFLTLAHFLALVILPTTRISDTTSNWGLVFAVLIILFGIGMTALLLRITVEDTIADVMQDMRAHPDQKRNT